MDLVQAVSEHERLFNASVRSGDFSDFVATFTEDAVMTFEDVPVGPFHGRAVIARAYAEQPPTDTMETVSVEETAEDTAHVRFNWVGGGSGSMRLRWRDGRVSELAVSFGQGG
jgi:steroid delta-isomerase